ncbi:MAG: hypothetical protein GY940_21040 [bacterium]|nr:hypothetical protein [bacterium]
MKIPDFNAEGALGPTVKKYRGQNIYGATSMAKVAPQQLEDYDDADVDDQDDVEDSDEDENEL